MTTILWNRGLARQTAGSAIALNTAMVNGIFSLQFTPGSAGYISQIVWGGGSTVDGAEIIWNPDHPDELQITSKRSISLNAGYGLGGISGGVIQIGSSGALHDVPFIQYDRPSAAVNGGSPDGYSKPFAFAMWYWNGSLLYAGPSIQAKRTAGGLISLEFYDGATDLPTFSAGNWVKGNRWMTLGATVDIAGNLLVASTIASSSFIQAGSTGFLTSSGEIRMNTTRFAGNSAIQWTWSSDATDANTGIDTGLKRLSAGQVQVTDGSTGIGKLTSNELTVASAANGATWVQGVATELLTLATGALFTDTAANLLPANAIIESVLTRVTTTITTAVSFSVGDPTTAARFSASAGGVTAASTRVGIDHWSGAVATLAAGPSQAAAAKVRITCNANPGAGIVRVTVYYRVLTAPTS